MLLSWLSKNESNNAICNDLRFNFVWNETNLDKLCLVAISVMTERNALWKSMLSFKSRYVMVLIIYRWHGYFHGSMFSLVLFTGGSQRHKNNAFEPDLILSLGWLPLSEASYWSLRATFSLSRRETLSAGLLRAASSDSVSHLDWVQAEKPTRFFIRKGLFLSGLISYTGGRAKQLAVSDKEALIPDWLSLNAEIIMNGGSLWLLVVIRQPLPWVSWQH